VTIGRGFGNLVGTNGATGAHGIVNQEHSAAQWRAHGFGQITRDTVSGAASRKGHHESDGLAARKILGLSDERQRCGRNHENAFHLKLLI
jgi:hypothetical protein